MGEQKEGGISFISALIANLSYIKGVGAETGKDTQAAEKEVFRQMSQAAKGGNPAKGEGVTKSGGDD
jgi:hypothetical protein